MNEIGSECLKCVHQYQELLNAYWRLRRKNRQMRKSFARIEGAILSRHNRHFEFIVGECEAYRENFHPTYK